MNKYFTLWSVGTPVAIVDRASGQQFWFDHLDKSSRDEAMKFERFDMNRRRFIKSR